MNFIHVSLLAGSALAVVPVLLHFLGRREPTRLTFPALRFVRQTAVQTQRGWSIKRWLLLAFRILLVLLAALAFASPRVHSAMLATYLSIGLIAILALLATVIALLSVAARHPTFVALGIAAIALGLWGTVAAWGTLAAVRGTAAPTQSATGPICAAIVIDTSPNMDYRFANVSRLEEAKETARWIMDRLPSDSQIAIVTSSRAQRLHQGRISANRQLENVKVEGRVANLPEAIRAAIELVRGSQLDRREIYVLTDMSANAWTDGEKSSIHKLLESNQETTPVLLQIVDLGTAKRENWSITQLSLSQESVAPGGSVDVAATIVASSDAPTTQVAVELLVEDRDPRLPIIRNGKLITPETVIKDRQNIDIEQGKVANVRFTLHELADGPTHAWLRLTRPDPLAIDNELAFTVEAETQAKVLVLGTEDKQGVNRGRLAALMIDSQLQYVDLREYGQLATLDLVPYRAIVMVDPPNLSETFISKIKLAVEERRGLMLIMGPALEDAKAWNASSLSKLLPGKVSRQWRRPITDRSIYLSPLQANHPLWSIFDYAASSIPWNRYPIFKYWVFDDLSDSASTIVRYTSSNHPALIEHAIGEGTILTITTTMTDVDSLETPPWNRLFASDDPVPIFGLLNGAVRYLSGSSQSSRNISVGAPVTLQNPLDRYPRQYDMFTPSGEIVRLQAQANTLHYPYADELGTYRLRSSQVDKPGLRGFSTHLDEQTINLRRIERESLNGMLGKDQFFYVRDRAELQNSLGQARFGRDLSPFLWCVFAALALGEQAMSYRFYSIGTATRR